MDGVDIRVRAAQENDRQRLANLIHFEEHVHRHLDWKPALDWIGSAPFLLAHHGDELLAALACPPDPEEVAWLRLFALAAGVPLDDTWEMLWAQAEKQLAFQGVKFAYALALQNWFSNLLIRHSFPRVQDVVVLVWESQTVKPEPVDGHIHVRPMKASDLPRVSQVDNLAFDLEWRNSQDMLSMAFHQASVATVAELEDEIIGYQISTQSPMGGHLARLAVLPGKQGHGVGSALVYALLESFRRRSVHRVTVNTQADNAASLAIYRKCGYHSTGEVYPVYRLTPAEKLK
jgi:ribosomal-protein-alanine N-acetyltransferase